ncbi:MAG: YggS family pyridoxal phosphate-dependent enzyme [Verrucomicrobiales bacterium]
MTLEDRWLSLKEQIARATERARRQAEQVRLVAVSKTHEPEKIQQLLNAGQIVFGESRVQEARAKMELVSGRAEWHFIGNLQKNKVKHLMPGFSLLHSLDSVELGSQLSRISEEQGWHLPVLLQVNVGRESSKHGFFSDTIGVEAQPLLEMPRLEVRGLMCLPPFREKPQEARRDFARVRELRDELERAWGCALPELSMGMSHDFEQAIAEGSTFVRVGKALFGERSGKTWRPLPDEMG